MKPKPKEREILDICAAYFGELLDKQLAESNAGKEATTDDQSAASGRSLSPSR